MNAPRISHSFLPLAALAFLVAGFAEPSTSSGELDATRLRSTEREPTPASDVIDFARQIRPVLAEHCFACHGPDEATREGDLRLDSRDGLFGDRGGYAAVVPGDLDASELWLRVADHGDPMPPADVESSFGDAERELLRAWIEQGAAWDRHWAFDTPVRPAAPAVEDEDWVRGPIDRFVLARLEREGLTPTEEASRTALLRRASFDLTGLPPTPEELDRFLADPSETAYEDAVDRLLASPHYGERQAMLWLDLARYADTNGDGYDGTRSMWPWRDWVIRSFNENKPFDQFTREQIAGDLLPERTRDTRLATGFHRNHTIFTKPGVAPDEYRHAYVVDRVNTTSTVWMGLTMGCVQCHDHKYDPISQEEYYGLYAYFNNVSERDVGRGGGNTPPTMVVPDEEQAVELDALIAAIDRIEAQLASETYEQSEASAAEAVWIAETLERLGEPVEWTVLEPISSFSLGGAILETLDDGSFLATGASPAGDAYHVVTQPGKTTVTAVRLEVLPHESFPEGGSGRSEKGTFSLNDFAMISTSVLQGYEGDDIEFRRAEDDVDPERAVDADKAVDGEERSGWALVGDEVTEPHEALFVPVEPVELFDQSLVRFELDMPFEGRYRRTIGRFRLSVTDDPRILRRRYPVLPGTWSSLGPFPAHTRTEALTTEFEPEADIAAELDLDAKYDKVELEEEPAGDEAAGTDSERGAPAERVAVDAAERPAGETPRAGTEGPREPLAEGSADPAERPSPAPPAGGPRGGPGAPAAAPGENVVTVSVADGGGEVAVAFAGDPGEIDFENVDFEDIDFANFDPSQFQGPGDRARSRRNKLSWEEQPEWREGQQFRVDGEKSAWYLTRTLDTEHARRARLLFEGVNGIRVWLDGELVHEREVDEERSGYSGGFGGFGFGGGGEENDADEDDDFDVRRSLRRPSYESFDLDLPEGESRLVVKLITGERSGRFRLRLQPLGPDVLSYAAEQALLREFGAAEPAPGELAVAEPAAALADAEGAQPSAAELERSARRRELVTTWYRRHVDEASIPTYAELDQLELDQRAFESDLPTAMVLDDDRPRTTHVLLRGEYDNLGVEVVGGVPSVLPPLPADAPGNRIALADWLVSEQHPLTARVAVNRVWAQYFGTGIVETTNDFGTRGAQPSHPELLDWLAVEFREGGWDVKALHRAIVTSATYRQGSRVTPEVLEADPDNRLFARGPRVRLAAEMVRDNALAVSGLLVPEVGGESVKPFQPAGVWFSGGFGGGGFGGGYSKSEGDAVWRRGLYVFWKRSVLYPSFAIFDAPTRQVCSSARSETNTPLQSLVVLNDDVYVEAARVLGERMLREGGASDASRLALGFRLCTSRLPSEDELGILLRVLGEQRAHYADDERAAKKFVKVGTAPVPEDLEPTELAAWAAVGNMLLGLDATIHKG